MRAGGDWTACPTRFYYKNFSDAGECIDYDECVDGVYYDENSWPPQLIGDPVNFDNNVKWEYVDACHADGFCSNLIGTFNCTCNDGFRLNVSDLWTCVEIDKCAEGIDECDADGKIIVPVSTPAGGHPVVRNNLHQTLPVLHKQYRLSVEIQPSGTVASYGSIVRVGLGGDNGIYGDRTPAIFFRPSSTALDIASAVNGDKNYLAPGLLAHALPLNKWTKLEVSQTRESDGYHYRIAINGLIVHDIINTDARTFTNVNVSIS